jgi:hypothetical protein
MRFIFHAVFTVASGSEILVSLKGALPRCFGEELTNHELLVIKADTVNPPGALLNLHVLKGLAEADINLKRMDKKFVLYQDWKKSNIGTALTSSSVTFCMISHLF